MTYWDTSCERKYGVMRIKGNYWMGWGQEQFSELWLPEHPLEVLVCTFQVRPSKEYCWHQGWNLPPSRFSWRRGLTYSQVKTWA